MTLLLFIGLSVAAVKISYSECETPIIYKIGVIDPKFKLKPAEVSKNVLAAAQLWGEKLFLEGSSEAKLIINFEYDERTALSTQINNLENKLTQKNATLNEEINIYEKDVQAFKKKLADFNASVDQWNSQGGAPPEVYEDLKRQQEQLQREGKALNDRAVALNIAATDYNSTVGEFNSDVGQFNLALTEKPEEGLYDGNTNTITIFFAHDKNELIHTLAHEFGHALGMGHASSSAAIMYANTSKSLKVTDEDRQMLDYACRPKPIINKVVTRLGGILRRNYQ